MKPDYGASVESISAITLTVSDMSRSVRFYRALGFHMLFGGDDADFSSFSAGDGYLNLTARAEMVSASFWGRVIFHVSDVDAFYKQVLAQRLEPEFTPRDAPWGERYFHVIDPDGHELSFAKPL